MNRDAMIEALAEAISAAILGKTATRGGRDAAAAVMDLCGPEPLVWRDSYGVLRAETPFGDYMVTGGIARRAGSLLHEITLPDTQPPQAAAQSHATAAHWSQTPLGKILKMDNQNG